MPKKFTKKKKLMAKSGYICLRGYIVPSGKVKGVKEQDRFVTFTRNAKMFAIADLQKRKDFVKGVKL